MFGVGGFANTPVSKCIFFSIIGLNMLGGIIGSNKGGAVATMGFGTLELKYSLIYRICTGNFIFSSVGELFFGLILLYSFRLFERHWGSQKFIVIFCFSEP
jgi:membrane associated rhomboid family serine protease